MPPTILSFVAPVRADAAAALDAALARLRARVAEPRHAPFARVPTLHCASLTLFPAPRDPAYEHARDLGPVLVLEQVFDGPLDAHLHELAAAAAPDLHAVLRHCEGYDAAEPEPAAIAAYLHARAHRPIVAHHGNPRHDRARVLAEADLRARLDAALEAQLAAAAARPDSPAAVHAHARALLDGVGLASVVDAPHERRTRRWEARQERRLWAARIATGVAVAAALPLVPFLLARERRDRSLAADALDPAHVRRCEADEDHGPRNHLASLIVVKPGRLRRLLLRGVLTVVALHARASRNGTLNGIASIHFAQWTLLDGGRRLLFLTNYDGAWGAYLDEFIERAALGLTAVWTNTVDFPPTRLLAWRGARDRVAFRDYVRHMQTPAAVRWAAYPSLTVPQVAANGRLREVLADTAPPAAELEAWTRAW